jgi:hypothetical protein
MNSKNNEPNPLHRGKEFHEKIQKEWLNTATGEVTPEKSIIKPSGRKGRADIFVRSDETLVAIAEIKASDWDSMGLFAETSSVKHAKFGITLNHNWNWERRYPLGSYSQGDLKIPIA